MPTIPKTIKTVIAGSGGFVDGSAVSLVSLRDQINRANGNVISLKIFRIVAGVNRALDEISP